MANGFGSLYVGASGLQSAQNALNVVANNLSNVDTKGYVRQQVIFEDKSYVPTHQRAAVSLQQEGLGVAIGDVVHARDVFLDKAYRSEAGRHAFYSANYEAASEVETLLNESNGSVGESFATSISDLYHAFSEFATSPAEQVMQNLIVQKADLFLSRAAGVYDGMKNYQENINSKISDDIDEINKLGDEIWELNKKIQMVEAGDVETAMDLRDQRDLCLDRLGELASISYSEQFDGIVKVKLEGTDFVIESRAYKIGKKEDKLSGFVTPYWEQLSDPENDDYYKVFMEKDADPTKNTDIGEVKALLLARGDHYSNFLDLKKEGTTDEEVDLNTYGHEIGNSIMLNGEAELDQMIHDLVCEINDLLSPKTEFGNLDMAKELTGGVLTYPITAVDENGNYYTITANTMVADTDYACVGSDGKVPPEEMFERVGAKRFTEVTLKDGSGNDIPDADGNPMKAYIFNEEDATRPDKCYTLSALSVNEKILDNPSLVAHRHQVRNDGDIAYDLGASIYAIWEKSDCHLNPSDKTSCGYLDYYKKMVGELATVGNVYKSTAENLQSTQATIEANRQAVIGVSTDEELQNMIKFQNAYNASSRYINVISTMIDTLLNMMG